MLENLYASLNLSYAACNLAYLDCITLCSQCRIQRILATKADWRKRSCNTSKPIVRSGQQQKMLNQIVPTHLDVIGQSSCYNLGYRPYSILLEQLQLTYPLQPISQLIPPTFSTTSIFSSTNGINSTCTPSCKCQA